ncbi:hypothetical protein K7432_003428 [Basidiobolus ranarum]|uniref:Metallothionein n=1 Tax=Basidiobolus ranarum TaxID=34480 RepID=A0ABR2W749_9FUNG
MSSTPSLAMDDELCLVCKKLPISYAPRSCGCPTLCKKCAMKQATGGKCRKCGEFFAELKKIRD